MAYAADSRRGFTTKPLIGIRKGMRITDESRPLLKMAIHRRLKLKTKLVSKPESLAKMSAV